MNVPLKDGIDDEGYKSVFKPVVQAVMETYRPTAVVLQCGADSLGCDRLGCFGLSTRGTTWSRRRVPSACSGLTPGVGRLASLPLARGPGHGECVRFVRSFRLPTLVVGGGGYTVKNVARCWTYETAVLLNTQVSNELPMNDYIDTFAPKFQLHPDITLRIDNLNSPKYLDNVRQQALENIRRLQGAPSVQMQEIPPELLLGGDSDDSEDEDPDERESQRALDRRIDFENDYYDGDQDQDGDLDV